MNLQSQSQTLKIVTGILGSIFIGLFLRDFNQYLEEINKPAHAVVKVESFSVFKSAFSKHIILTTHDGESYMTDNILKIKYQTPHTLGILMKYETYTTKENYDIVQREISQFRC